MLDGDRNLEVLLQDVTGVVDCGVSSFWCSQIFGFDAVSLMALLGRETSRIELGTAVVPVYGRHPLVLAMQARTAQAASGGRFALGVGLSHQLMVEGVYGLSYEHPAAYMREYLSALVPALSGEQVNFQGERVSANMLGPLQPAGVEPVGVVVAALGSAMLKVAGELASGTITWMTGVRTIGSHIVPGIRRAAEDAGRGEPRIVAGLPVCVTQDVASAREKASRIYAIYGSLPSYRAMLDREGAGGPADVAVAGSEEEVEAALLALADAGATDFMGAPFGTKEERARTIETLGRLNG